MASKKQTSITRPVARSERLVVEAVGDETVIYDQDTQVAHALQPLAAAVFMYADGDNTVEQIAELVSYRLDRDVAVADVNEAVEQLEACEILDTPAGILSGGISRRTALKTFAAAGAGTMLVSSVAAPFASATTLGNYGSPYKCCYVGSSPNLTDSGGSYGTDPKVSSSKAPNGWSQPYVKSGTNYQMATGTVAGAPQTAGDYNLGASCYAVGGSSPVYGTYQVIPCDGSTYECADVVCVPTSNGNSITAKTSPGTPLAIAGAITSGPIYTHSGASSFGVPSGVVAPGYGPYTDYAYTQYPFKVCCGNGTTSSCNHS
jgi:coenzyme PQQ synthesis protein D (PqqD)